MHDFCFTLPFGSLLILGGLIGFLRKSSLNSLLGGGGAGLLLLLLGVAQLDAFKKGRSLLWALLLELGISLGLSLVMWTRFSSGGKFMPAGIVFVISGIMTLFYFFKLVTGGNHVARKLE